MPWSYCSISKLKTDSGHDEQVPLSTPFRAVITNLGFPIPSTVSHRPVLAGLPLGLFYFVQASVTNLSSRSCLPFIHLE